MSLWVGMHFVIIGLESVTVTMLMKSYVLKYIEIESQQNETCSEIFKVQNLEMTKSMCGVLRCPKRRATVVMNVIILLTIDFFFCKFYTYKYEYIINDLGK